MKKLVLLAILSIVTLCLFAATPRVYTQVLVTDQGNLLPGVENTSASHHPDYYMEVFVTTRPTEVISTTLNAYAQIKIYRFGNGSAAVPYATVAQYTIAPFPTQWTAGEVLRTNITHISTGETSTWDCVIPTGTAAWGHRQTINPFPDGVVAPPYSTGPTDYTISGMFTTTNWDFADINIVATGIDAEDIVINGANYEITVPEGWSGTVTPTKAGYIMTPANREYTNVEADFENQNYAISKNVDPNAPVITYPTQGMVFTPAVEEAVTITWEALPGQTFDPEFYEIQWNLDQTWVGLAPGVTEWTTPVLGDGVYTFMVRGVINTPMGKATAPAFTSSSIANSNTRGAGSAAQVSFEVQVTPIVYSLLITSDPEDASIWMDGNLSNYSTPFETNIAGTYSVAMEGYTFLPEEYVWDGMTDAAINFVGTVIPPEYDIDPTNPTVVIPALPGETTTTSVTITGPGFVGANVLGYGDYTPGSVPNPAFVPTFGGVWQFEGSGVLTIVIASTDPWFIYRTIPGGEWVLLANDGTGFTFTIDLGAKAPASIEFMGGGGGMPTLPVELSSFNAVLTAQKFVKLSWISESETNMLGYRVYRAESADQASALLITPIMIEATNTSSTQNYNLEDREVNSGNTYYYWLEAVDYGPSSFFGPQYVEVLADVAPELPVQSAMKNAYPNPFKSNSAATIEVSVKAGETANVTIYNVLGQAVKTYRVNEGSHNLTWNGRDSKGNLCGSGIYFYKMSTPSMNQTKKMVIVK